MFDKHCSDEQLLAHADHQLSSWRETRVSWHLQRCWYCRARLQELEEQAQAVARALLGTPGLWPTRIAEAKNRFLEHQKLEERLLARGARVGRDNWTGFRWLMAACSLLLAVAGALFWLKGDGLPPAERIVARCREKQAVLEASPVHQVFAIEIRQVKPVAAEQRGHLEVWSDAGGSRYASRWTAADGFLVQALWRPSDDQDYVLDARAASVPQRRTARVERALPLSELAQTGLDPQAIERELLRWLASREWRPVSASNGLLRYVAGDGATIRAGRCGALVCLSATRTEGGLSAELLLEIDPDSSDARLQRVVVESATRRIEFTLRLERMETGARVKWTPGMFEPVTSGLRLPDLASRITRATVPATKTIFDPAALDAREIEVWLALHRVGACMGEPVEVVRGPHGALAVRGLVDSPVRKQQIMNGLAELDALKWLEIEIRTPADLHGSGVKRTRILGAAGDTADTVAGPAGQFPKLEAITRFYERHSGPDVGREDVRRYVARFSIDAVGLSDSMMRHAWALRRLAERFGSKPGLSTPLRAMVRDHLLGLHDSVSKTRALLSPVWAIPMEDTGDVAAWRAGAWDAIVFRLFDPVDQLHQRMYQLFAGAGDDAAPAEILAQQVTHRLASLGRQADQTAEAVESRFSGVTVNAGRNE